MDCGSLRSRAAGVWAAAAMCALLVGPGCAGGAEGDAGGTFGSGNSGGSSMTGSGTGDMQTSGGPSSDTNSNSGQSMTGPSSMTSSNETDGGSGEDTEGSGGGDSEEDPACEDQDGDGYGDNCQAGEDCDDEDEEINPGVAEVCDDVDRNCDGDPQAGCECPDDGVGGDCNAPFELGTLAMGEAQLGVVGNVPTEGAVDWYIVSFPATARPGEGMPTLSFAINEEDAFVFDVVQEQCGTMGVACTSGGTMGVGMALTEWTFVDDDPMCCTPPMDSMVPWPDTVYVRVYRTTPGSSCAAYQLQASREPT